MALSWSKDGSLLEQGWLRGEPLSIRMRYCMICGPRCGDPCGARTTRREIECVCAVPVESSASLRRQVLRACVRASVRLCFDRPTTGGVQRGWRDTTIAGARPPVS